MNAKSLKMFAIPFALFGATFPAHAFASCDDVGSSTWNSIQSKMNQSFEAGDYDAALSYGKQLTMICDRNPIVNTVISDVYDKKGMPEDSYKYIRRASDYVSEFDLPMPLLEKIWFKRAEFELPYKKQAESLQQQLDSTIVECQAQKESFEKSLEEGSMSSRSTLTQSIIEMNENYRKSAIQSQWIGTGVAAAGGAIAIVGGALLGVYYSEANDEYAKLKNGDTNHFQRSNQIVQAGAGILGAGLALGIAGSVAAIYSHLKIKKIEKARNEIAFDIQVQPNYLGMTMTF